MIFQPYELNDLEENSDLDPDNNYYIPQHQQNLANSTYYHLNNLNKEIVSKSQNHFSNFTLNIRSLPKNHRQLVTLLESIDTKFHTITLTETWLKAHNEDLFEIENYSHESQTRENKDGGGLYLYQKLYIL